MGRSFSEEYLSRRLSSMTKVMEEMRQQVNALTDEHFRLKEGLARAEQQLNGANNLINIVLEMMGRTGLAASWPGWETTAQREELFRECFEYLREKNREAVALALKEGRRGKGQVGSQQEESNQGRNGNGGSGGDGVAGDLATAKGKVPGSD